MLPERFLPPPGFVWGSFTARDGAVLRWGHLPVANARAECVMAGGFGEFIEKQFETVRDLAARGVAVWCLDWRGQGGSIRPRRLPTRPRARKFDRDAEDLAAFASAKLTQRLAASVGGAFDGRRDRALMPAPSPEAVRGGGAVVADGGAAHRQVAADPDPLHHDPGARRRARRLLHPGRRQMAAGPHPDAREEPRQHRRRSAAGCAMPGSRPSRRLRLDEATYGWVDSALGLVARISKPEFLGAIKTPILMGRPGPRGRRVDRRRSAGRRACCRTARWSSCAESKHDPFLERDAIRDDWLSCLDRFIAERLVKTSH